MSFAVPARKALVKPEHCFALFHNTQSAYRIGCRCPQAVAAMREGWRRRRTRMLDRKRSETEMRVSWDDTWLRVARVIAERSKCVRDQVGAVIVDPSNRIVATGYNGPPANFKVIDLMGDDNSDMPCNFWCPRAQKDNGFRAPEVMREILTPDYSDCPSLHAEANALSVCDRSVREGGTIYITSGMCYGCAKLVANSGLKRVVVVATDAPHRNLEKSYELLRTCDIEVYERILSARS